MDLIPLRAGWMTISGSVRDHNEDAIGIYERDEAALYVIADGVGGAEAGELVSAFAIRYVLTQFHNAPDDHWSALFRDALDSINAEVRRFTEDSARQTGREFRAGSTFTGVVIDGWKATVAHVGDSRLYRWRDGVAVVMTEDHSRAPNDDPTAAKHNVLMRGIGKDEYVRPDVFTLDLQPDDRLLLCSDGMSDKIGE
ncbi:MAG: protein phosphatase 2C domain-containing protein, partial [Chloroflexota bacterium]